jgi:hypothetical protein
VRPWWISHVILVTEEEHSSRPVQAKPLWDPISMEKLDMAVQPAIPVILGKCQIKGPHPGQPGRSEIPTSNITRAKRAGGVAQVPKCLPSQAQSCEFKSWYHQKKKREREHMRAGEVVSGPCLWQEGLAENTTSCGSYTWWQQHTHSARSTPTLRELRWKHKRGESESRCLGKKRDPISKITRAKRAGRVAQVRERLPYKF